MGKSLNYIGKKSGKREQLETERIQKQEKKEKFKEHFNSKLDAEDKTPPWNWHCSKCYLYKHHTPNHDNKHHNRSATGLGWIKRIFYFYKCDNADIHENEWVGEVRRRVWKEGKRLYKDANIETGRKNKGRGLNKNSGKVFQRYSDEDNI